MLLRTGSALPYSAAQRAAARRSCSISWRKHLSKQFCPCVQLIFPQMPSTDLLAYLADELAGPKNDGQQTIDRTVRRIQQFVNQNAAEDQHAVIAIEEAHLIDDNGHILKPCDCF